MGEFTQGHILLSIIDQELCRADLGQGLAGFAKQLL
ncbi:hypothetical protein EBI_25494 [Enterocytozoon bieneusi H348]|nr:hypothetical protein EBI_25494 [Enterocytozoon bieneusi H348]|eukprot:XP_002652305.1 hypothetical protein EBI_25494 [Enterocytozoon bieneusi H348]